MTLFPSVAVFLQHAHGEYQVELISSLPYPGRLFLYEVNDCVTRPAGLKGAAHAPLTSITEIDASIFLFIQLPLESVNHRFLVELVQTTLLTECGIATGITLAADKSALNLSFADSFFAVKRELLCAAGGLPMVSSQSIKRLADALTRQSGACGLQMVTAKYALATLSELATVH